MRIPFRLKQITRSIQWRLVALFIALAFAMTAAFIAGTQRSFASGWRDTIRPVQADYVDRLTNEIGSPPNEERAKELVARLPISIRIAGPSVNYESHIKKESKLSELHTQNQATRTTADGHTIYFGMGDLEWRNYPTGAALKTLLLLLTLTALAYFAVRSLLKPLDDLSAGASRYGAGNFRQPIPIRRNDELGDLAKQINRMAVDIDGMLEAKRGLLLAISHELRTPLTRSRVNIELLPDNPDSANLRNDLLRDFGLMSQLINDLLESERLNDRHAALNREAVDIKVLVEQVLSELPGGQSVVVSIPQSLQTQNLDSARIRLLLRNLLENALSHASDAVKPPELKAHIGNKQLKIVIRDFGRGVEQHNIANLAQPFYRTDQARQRSTGGIGLGLYLCRLVAQAHGGEIKFEVAQPGLRVEVIL